MTPPPIQTATAIASAYAGLEVEVVVRFEPVSCGQRGAELASGERSTTRHTAIHIDRKKGF
jgi:hypothetical protein